jgi:hypothetical protein
MNATREAGMMVITGVQGVGKTYLNMHVIKDYVKDKFYNKVKGRKCLIFDTNGEYTESQFDRNDISNFNVRRISLKDVEDWSRTENQECRRIEAKNFSIKEKKEAVEFLQHAATEKARELPDRANDMGNAEWKKAWADRWQRVQAASSIAVYVKCESPQYVVLGEDPVVQPLQALDGMTITMNQSDVSFREALQYLADLAGLKMKVGPGKLLFEPKD